MISAPSSTPNPLCKVGMVTPFFFGAIATLTGQQGDPKRNLVVSDDSGGKARLPPYRDEDVWLLHDESFDACDVLLDVLLGQNACDDV